MNKRKKRQSGFSLLELLIVVAIILLIVAIGLPALSRARASGANANGAATIRSVNTAISMYVDDYNALPANLGVLGGDCTTAAPTPALSCKMPNGVITLMTGASGYNNYTWTYAIGTNGGYSVTATPISGGVATRSYWSDGQVTTYNDAGAATNTSPVLGN